MAIDTRLEANLERDVWPVLVEAGYTPVWKNKEKTDICVEGAKIYASFGGYQLGVRSDSFEIPKLLDEKIKILGHEIHILHGRADNDMEPDPSTPSLTKRFISLFVGPKSIKNRFVSIFLGD